MIKNRLIYSSHNQRDHHIIILIFICALLCLNIFKYPVINLSLIEYLIPVSNSSFNFIEPIMKHNEKKVFYRYLVNAKIFFEFGSGGSTHQAALKSLKIYTVEHGPEWHDLIKRDFINAQKIMQNFNPNIHYITFNFSTELDPPIEELQNYTHAYRKEYNADLIFVNGNFKQSCLIDIWPEISDQTIVIAYDVSIENKMSQLYSVIEKTGKILVLKKNKLPEKLKLAHLKHQYERWPSNGMKIMQFLTNYKDIINKYKNKEDIFIKPSSPIIWTMWWDGEANAPEVIRLCIKTIRDHFKFGKVLCISKENYTNFTTIPSYVIDKLKSNTISLTHFSDILRVNLIMNQGGMWLDSTIFCHEDIQHEWFEKPFYTVHRENNFPIGGGKWTVFDIAGYKNSITYQFINDIFMSYMKSHSRFPHYFFFDECFLYGYTFIPIIRRYIDDVPLTVNYVSEMFYSLNKPYNKEEYDKITEFSYFSKLSYKKPLPDEVSGKITMYKYLKDIAYNYNKK